MTTVMAYLHAEDVHAAGLSLAGASLAGSGQTLIGDTTSVKVVQSPGTIPAQIGLHVVGKTKPTLDAAVLAARIAGKSIGDAAAILDAAGKKAGWQATVTTDPSLAHRLPVTPRLITVRFAN
jgi:hypothetical protein